MGRYRVPRIFDFAYRVPRIFMFSQPRTAYSGKDNVHPAKHIVAIWEGHDRTKQLQAALTVLRMFSPTMGCTAYRVTLAFFYRIPRDFV